MSNINEYITEAEYAALSEEERMRLASIIFEANTEKMHCQEVCLSSHKIYRKYVKRILDIVISLLALIVSIPFNVFVLIGTMINIGFPLFFSQERVGCDGKVFKMVKFRNMTNDVDENGNLLLPELRLKKWGKFVRKTSLDELLNFWSILKGDMSIIGPRPLPVKYSMRYSERHMQRSLVRPGLECPAFNAENANGGWNARFENDIWYVENVSFKTDIKMVCLLVKKVFSFKSREQSAGGKDGEFMGYENEVAIDCYHVPRKYYDELLSSRCIDEQEIMAG